jgi:transposase
VMSQALTLHYFHGLPLCKVPAVIASTAGIALSQSALTQAAGALCSEGGRVQVIYQQLREQVSKAKVVNTDDTGWRINGVLAFLMGFFTPILAVYQVRWRHRHEEVVEMLGVAFRGLLGTDRGVSYEASALDYIRQQKCLSHLLKNLSTVELTCRGRAKVFAREIKAILRAGIKLWNDYRAGNCTRAEYRTQGETIQQQLTEALRIRKIKDVDNQRLLDGIGYQHDCGRVFLFLEHPEIEPTNNRAERGLRPAVIARKISHCSKNEQGARIYEAMKSVTTTLALRGENVARALANIMMGAPMPNALRR